MLFIIDSYPVRNRVFGPEKVTAVFHNIAANFETACRASNGLLRCQESGHRIYATASVPKGLKSGCWYELSDGRILTWCPKTTSLIDLESGDIIVGEDA